MLKAFNITFQDVGEQSRVGRAPRRLPDERAPRSLTYLCRRPATLPINGNESARGAPAPLPYLDLKVRSYARNRRNMNATVTGTVLASVRVLDHLDYHRPLAITRAQTYDCLALRRNRHARRPA
jgi:hypothetical protein